MRQARIPSINTRRGFFPADRVGMSKNSDMVGKIPPEMGKWQEKFRHGKKKYGEGYMQA
jgi:hypothetical protein